MASSSKDQAPIAAPTNRHGRPILASLYDLTEYDSDEEFEKYPTVPAQNLASAAMFTTNLFARFQVPSAIMGGFAVKLSGSSRDTRDVDICFQAPRKFADMWDIVDQESRLIIPQQRTISDVVKIFVKTGGEWDKCALPMPVEVDLIMNGSNSSPEDVLSHRKLVNFGNNQTVYIVDLFYLLKGKFNAFATRQAGKDYEDIVFLTNGNESKIAQLREYLDPTKIRTFIDSLDKDSRDRYAEIYGIKL